MSIASIKKSASTGEDWRGGVGGGGSLNPPLLQAGM